MLCPEGELIQNEPVIKEDEPKICRKKHRKVPTEGSGSLELRSFTNPKTWKNSITNFFRNQLRSTRSNDGDLPSGDKFTSKFEEKVMSPEQKWQSLGKVFRRQSLAEHWTGHKSPSQQGESSSHSQHKRGVKKVLSGYFGKYQKSLPVPDE